MLDRTDDPRLSATKVARDLDEANAALVYLERTSIDLRLGLLEIQEKKIEIARTLFPPRKKCHKK